MPILKAWPLVPGKANWVAILTGLSLLCLSGCSPLVLDQKEHGRSVQKALEAQLLSPSRRDPPSAPLPPAASELKPAYDRYLLPPPSSGFAPQLP